MGLTCSERPSAWQGMHSSALREVGLSGITREPHATTPNNTHCRIKAMKACQDPLKREPSQCGPSCGPGQQNFAARPHELPPDAMSMNKAFAMRDDEAWSSDKMTAKVPPAYDGITSFFAHEEYVEEWLLITPIEESKQAPLLRFRLKGNALTCEKLLNQDRLQQAGSVKYFPNTLRPFFVKDCGHVSL